MPSELDKYQTIFWDFDGVIMDSMVIRDMGFVSIFSDYDHKQVEKLLEYHRYNGGLSRYVKIRYFFEKIIGVNCSEEMVYNYASKFSKIMLKLLNNRDLLISDSIEFIKENRKRFNFHIVSGSDQAELKKICQNLELEKYFLSIHGSPIPKKELISNILATSNYSTTNCCLIGDSINDYQAAKENSIKFYAYNNEMLQKEHSYIVSFKEDIIIT